MTNDWRQLFAHPVYQRLFRSVRKKYERLERVGGTVQLSLRDDAERDALSGLLGRDLRGRRTVTVRLEALDRILQQSIVGRALPDFLEDYFGEQLVLRSTVRRAHEEKWRGTFCGAREVLARLSDGLGDEQVTAIDAWLYGLEQGTAAGSVLWKRLYNEQRAQAQEMLQTVVVALSHLPVWPIWGSSSGSEVGGSKGAYKSSERNRVDESIHKSGAERRNESTPVSDMSDRTCRTPVFATQLTGDPHALDVGEPLANLFLAALTHTVAPAKDCAVAATEMEAGLAQDAATAAVPLETTFEQAGRADAYVNCHADISSINRRTLLAQVGLLDDDISSNVTTFGLTVEASGADAVDATIPFPARDYPFVLTLRHLRQAWPWVCARPLYVVENPSVFSAVIDAWESEPSNLRPQLVVTSGQPHLAALKLLEQWVARGGMFYYSGDFDWKGIEMAVRLQRMYPTAFRPWRFDSETYSQYEEEITRPVPPYNRRQLVALQVPWDPELPQRVAAGGCLYQEHIVDLLVRDALGGDKERAMN